MITNSFVESTCNVQLLMILIGRPQLGLGLLWHDILQTGRPKGLKEILKLF